MNKQNSVFGKKVIAFITSLGFAAGALGVSVAVAAITFSNTSITGDSSFNSIVGATSTTWDLGASNLLSLQTTNNGPITAGSGLFTIGGILNATNIDRAGTIAIGTSSATGITIGRSNQTVTIGGNLTVNGTLTPAASSIALSALATSTAANIIVANSSNVPTYVTMSGDATISSAGVITLATSGVTAGTYGSATLVPVITVDAKGRITTVTTSSVSAAPGGSNTQLQYNNAGVFAGDANLTWTTSTQILTVTGSSTFVGILNATNIDRAGVINIGTSSATGVTIGRSGTTLTVPGSLSVGTTSTFTGILSVTNIDQAGTIAIGTSSATGITIGRSGVAVVFGGNASTTGTFTITSASTGALTVTGGGSSMLGPVVIAGGTPILKHLSATSSITFGIIASTTCAVQTMTVTGANAGDNVYAAPTPVAGGIDTASSTWSVWATANTVNIRACNPTAANTASISAQTWRADVWQH